jgi:hypothetical protein
MSIEAPGTAFGFASNQFVPGDDDGFGVINTLLSYMWVKSDKYGTLNWGLLSQATDNVALLPDLSGTIIESNAVMFEGANFRLRAKGTNNNQTGLLNSVWGTFLMCDTAGLGIGADCNGVPLNAVRYDSPTFFGFSLSSSWGEDDFWDVALKYAADWNTIKLSAAAGYTHLTDERYLAGGGGIAGFKKDDDLFQVGASAMHVPSGLFIYGLYQYEKADPTPSFFPDGPGFAGLIGASTKNETDVWYLKGGIKRTWLPLGATVLFAEYAEYRDQFGAVKGVDGCVAGQWLTTTAAGGGVAPACANSATGSVFLSGSEVQRWGLGAVQEIDSAAMHLWARYQHLDLDIDINDGAGANLNQDFDSWQLFQVGGVIFF